MYEGKRVLAIIPARQGSKRLPNKNILILNGKPLIAWTIEAAKESMYIDRIIVSTDSDKIAELSKVYGVEVPALRPNELATDHASSIDVVLHEITNLNNNKKNFDLIILLQPTSPLRTSEDVDNAFKMLEDKAKAVISVCETEHPPLWSNTLPDDLSMKDFIRPEARNKRSQDLPKYYRLNGAIYIAEINYLINQKTFIGKYTKAFIMSQERSVDIDSKLDFEFCDFLMSRK